VVTAPYHLQVVISGMFVPRVWPLYHIWPRSQDRGSVAPVGHLRPQDTEGSKARSNSQPSSFRRRGRASQLMPT